MSIIKSVKPVRNELNSLIVSEERKELKILDTWECGVYSLYVVQ